MFLQVPGTSEAMAAPCLSREGGSEAPTDRSGAVSSETQGNGLQQGSQGGLFL